MTKRNTMLDIIKTFAILGVISIHVVSRVLTGESIGTAQWNTALFWATLFRASVPLFLMCSGALMLDREKPLSIKKLYLHNMLRIVIAMLVWGFLYKIYHLKMNGGLNFEQVIFSLKRLFLFDHEFHFYYIHIILIVYAFLPITRILTDKADKKNINSYSLLVPVVAHPETTYTNSSFTGIMMPQEFYRISNNESLSAMYFKDTAPDGCTKAVLTVYAGVIGEIFDTTLKLCALDADTELKHLAGSNTPISKNSVSLVSLNAIGMPVIYGRNIQKMEYDITAMLPENGGDFVFAVLPEVIDEDYIVLPSHYNSDYSLRPRIKYYQ